MKRSEINAIIHDADAFLRLSGFYLPPFAYWTPEDWQSKRKEAHEIIDHRLGWDVTDFGQGDYRNVGLCVFTLRNGESITIPQYCYHTFWAEESRTLVGEVSLVNDDNLDNRFHEQMDRFAIVEEDELPFRLLVSDYI